MKRAGLYIDGFNMYGAICESGQNHLKWLSYKAVASRIVRIEQPVLTKFFTALRGADPDQDSRHMAYVSALELEGVRVVMGRFKSTQRKCKLCRGVYLAKEEKETDVNLGAHLVHDVVAGLIDAAYVFTTDSDLTGAVRLALQARPGLRVVNVHVKTRKHCKEILGLASEGFLVEKQGLSLHMLQGCLLPEALSRPDGSVIRRPSQYMPPGAAGRESESEPDALP